MKRAFRFNWAVRDAETGEQLSGLFSFKRDAEKRLSQLDFMGRPLEVYRVTLKPWPDSEKAARDLGFNVDSPSWDEARKDWKGARA
jgi:hypothetical protein